VNSFEMILPSDKLLNKFQSIVEPMMEKISNNEFETQSLRKTRDTLLPKLMSGQVRVNNMKNT
jgi:type I restriction enzyme S subunit